jgi:hypothetical protein
MLECDEVLIRAVERLIDGGNGHHYYGTIHRYRQAAMKGEKELFAHQEYALRMFVLHRARDDMPTKYKEAIALLCNEVNEHGAICEECKQRKLHGQKCPGPMAGKYCWNLRDCCEGSDGRCCTCAKSAHAQ